MPAAAPSTGGASPTEAASAPAPTTSNPTESPKTSSKPKKAKLPTTTNGGNGVPLSEQGY
jgi:hypothetical protein